jgi:hypothetical protein
MARPTTLVLDSRDDTSKPSLDSFTIRLEPALVGVRRVRLLYANIANPEDDDGELYWYIRIPQLGLGVRGGPGTSGGTFVVPVSSAQGYRTVHRAESEFDSILLQEPAGQLDRLDVSLALHNGAAPGLTHDWHLVLGLEY